MSKLVSSTMYKIDNTRILKESHNYSYNGLTIFPDPQSGNNYFMLQCNIMCTYYLFIQFYLIFSNYADF